MSATRLLIALFSVIAFPALAASRLLAPSAWMPNIPGFYQVMFGTDAAGRTHQWDVLNGQMAWSLSGPDVHTVRFESRGGDRPFAWDKANADPALRTEIATFYETQPLGTWFHASYGLTIEPGERNDALWLHLQQLHWNAKPGTVWHPELGENRGPIAGISLAGGSDNMIVEAAWPGANGIATYNVLYYDPKPIVRGRRYAMEEWALPNPAGNGRLVVKRDGLTIVDYSGPLGSNAVQNVYWKHGIYRSNGAKVTMAADVDHLILATGPLAEHADQAPVSRSSRALVTVPTLTLSKVSGPFVNDRGSFRAAVSIKVPVGASVSFMIDGRAVNPAQVVPGRDGSYTLSTIRVSADGSQRITVAFVDGIALAPAKLQVSGGTVIIK